MKSIEINVQNLLKTIIENRKNHEENYKKALKKYKQEFSQECLKQMDMSDNDESCVPKISSDLNPPIEYLKDYDETIGMLKLHEGSTISLSSTEYNQLILDKWSWSQHLLSSNSKYIQP